MSIGEYQINHADNKAKEIFKKKEGRKAREHKTKLLLIHM